MTKDLTLAEASEFAYLASMVQSSRKYETEIRVRTGTAETAFEKKHRTLTSKTLSKNVKVRLVKYFIWSVALYGAETWTSKKSEET